MTETAGADSKVMQTALMKTELHSSTMLSIHVPTLTCGRELCAVTQNYEITDKSCQKCFPQ